MKRKPMSIETKRKISLTKLHHPVTDETKEKMRQAHLKAWKDKRKNGYKQVSKILKKGLRTKSTEKLKERFDPKFIESLSKIDLNHLKKVCKVVDFLKKFGFNFSIWTEEDEDNNHLIFTIYHSLENDAEPSQALVLEAFTRAKITESEVIYEKDEQEYFDEYYQITEWRDD